MQMSTSLSRSSTLAQPGTQLVKFPPSLQHNFVSLWTRTPGWTLRAALIPPLIWCCQYLDAFGTPWQGVYLHIYQGPWRRSPFVTAQFAPCSLCLPNDSWKCQERAVTYHDQSLATLRGLPELFELVQVVLFVWPLLERRCCTEETQFSFCAAREEIGSNLLFCRGCIWGWGGVGCVWGRVSMTPLLRL